MTRSAWVLGCAGSQMGLFETYRTAGGEAGMRHFIAQFGPCLEWPWTRLMDVPELTDDLIDKIAEQSDAHSGSMSVRELERHRDQNLVGLLRALKDRNSAAGAHINAHQEKLAEAYTFGDSDGQKLRLLELQVLPSWIDYNGHMTEFRYLQVFADTSDALLRLIGLDMDYVAAGYSYYTVESHIMHHGECKLGERLYVTTQILAADDKRLHVFHTLHGGMDDRVVATAEHMMLHVDSGSGRACPALPQIREKLDPLVAAHADLPIHEVVGRFTGQRRAS